MENASTPAVTNCFAVSDLTSRCDRVPGSSAWCANTNNGAPLLSQAPNPFLGKCKPVNESVQLCISARLILRVGDGIAQVNDFNQLLRRTVIQLAKFRDD